MVGGTGHYLNSQSEPAGIKSAWIHHGRRWKEPAYRPDLVANSIDEALDGIWAREPGLGSHVTADLT